MKANNCGCSQYPCWRCRPCHNAVKGIETAARKRNQSKMLNKFRTDPATRQRWKRIVALIRIPEGADCPNSYELQVFDEEGYPGAPTPATKMLRVEPFLKMLKHEESMEEIDDRLFLTERQYKCHLKLFEDYKPAEAQEKWDHDSLETSGVARKKNKHNELTLAMEIPMCLRHVNRVLLQTSISKDDTSMTDEDIFTRLRAFMQGGSDTRLADLVDGTAAFQPGNAAFGGPAAQKKQQPGRTSADTVAALLSGKTGGSRGSSASSAVSSVSAGAAAACGQLGPNLVSLLSEESLGTLTLSAARTGFKFHAQGFIKRALTLKSSPLNKLEALILKMGSDHVEVTALKVDEDIKALKEAQLVLNKFLHDTKTWCDDTYKKHYIEALKKLDVAEQMDAKLQASLTSLSGIRLVEVQYKSGKRRVSALAVRRIMKGPGLTSCWSSAVTWVGCKLLGLETSEEVHIENVVPTYEGRDKPWDMPMISDEENELHDIFQPRIAMLEPKIEEQSKKIQQFLEDSKKEPLSLARVRAASPKQDDANLDQWMPADFVVEANGRVIPLLPEMVSKLGNMFAFSAKANSFRDKWEHLPFQGTSAFFSGFSGRVALMSFPMSSVTSRGGSLANVTEFFGKMTPSDCDQFFGEVAVGASLEKGRTVFIPAGFYTVMWHVDEFSTVVYQPLFITHVYKTLDSKIKQHIISTAETFLKANQNNPNGLWKSTCSMYSRWVTGVA